MLTLQRTILLLCFSLFVVPALQAQDQKTHAGKTANNSGEPQTNSGDRQFCEAGFAGEYPCDDVDLLAFLSIRDIVDGLSVFVTATNDIWGWTDPMTGVEYALVGMSSGTAFVDLSDPVNPKPIGYLVSKTGSSVWRDIKVYKDHAFIVADAAANHGMQVFDLTQLRTVENPPVILDATVDYSEIGSAHNIAINEASGYAYIVGGNAGGQTCGGGLHMVNISTPTEPVFEGCYADPTNGYTHDVQCVNYAGPDTEHQGKEICFASNEVLLSIADVTNKSAPQRLSFASYPNVGYTHQGWLSEDHRYFFMDDENDEANGLITNTRTLIWDVEDLDDPVLALEYAGTTVTADHNQYVRGNYLYQSNYTSGVRILNIENPTSPVEVAYFDVLPDDESTSHVGSWSNYPYFESGIVIATSRFEGFFVLAPTMITFPTSTETPETAHLEISPIFPNPVVHQTRFTLQPATTEQIRVDVYDILGRRVATLYNAVVSAGSTREIAFDRGSLPSGTYYVRVSGESTLRVLPVSVIDR